MNYFIVIEKTETGYSAYAPDLPGCVATGPSFDIVQQRMRDGIEFHIEGLILARESVPKPASLK